jgi:2-(3-amino-3-carboxypropyl)histidine synthase
MDTVFIDAAASVETRLTKSQLQRLPRPIGIVTTVQHAREMKSVQKQVHDSVFCGTVLGCNVSSAIKKKVKAFLFIGTGRFHPLMLAFKGRKPVYVFNPYDQRLSVIEEQDLMQLQKRKKSCLIKFLQSSTIGIIVSTKPGQQELLKAMSLKRSTKKKCYILLADCIDTNSLQNFPFVDCFVNTACPRLAEESAVPMINLDDLSAAP